jgi:hypothetical protein
MEIKSMLTEKVNNKELKETLMLSHIYNCRIEEAFLQKNTICRNLHYLMFKAGG